MRVLLDTNAILDSILQRPPWHLEADAILQAAAQGQVTCAVATLSVATVFYVSRKTVGTATARAAVSKCLNTLEILPVDKQSLLAADAMPGSDFEDNILIAAAVVAPVDAIVTRNVAHFSHAPLPVWEPAELMKRLAGGSSPPTGGTSPAAGPP